MTCKYCKKEINNKFYIEKNRDICSTCSAKLDKVRELLKAGRELKERCRPSTEQILLQFYNEYKGQTISQPLIKILLKRLSN